MNPPHPSLECRSNAPSWGGMDFLWWKTFGGIAYIQKYKDGWVKYNQHLILRYASIFELPAPLLAGVCWIEVGGDPHWIDRIAFEIRSFDWSGSDWIDGFAVTRHPQQTSFGAVSMQLRTAAVASGLNPEKLSRAQWNQIALLLTRDCSNIQWVAKHLRDLVERDGFQNNLPHLMPEQISIVGARYNRGSHLSLDEIKTNTSYGDFINRYWIRFNRLLYLP